jgi:flagellar basal body-associated protein FliL
MAAGAPPIQIQKKKSGIGCFGCGCIILIVIVLLLIGLLGAGGYLAYNGAKNLTDTSGVSVAQADGGDAVYASAQQKVNDFEQAFENRQPATLQLSDTEINTLIARDPAYAKLRGHVAVQLANDAANVQASYLLGDLEEKDKPLFADRYLNGNASLGLSFDPNQHMLLFDIRALHLKDRDLPSTYNTYVGAYLSQIVKQQTDDNQIARDFLARVQKVDIENGNLVIQIN